MKIDTASIYRIRPTHAREMTIEYLSKRFSNSFDISESGCWNWKKSIDKDGYSQIGLWGRYGSNHKSGQFPAHRVMYELIKGEMKPDEQIDHLCKNILCVNPAHLEAVDKDTNNIRGNSPSAIHARKTHCPKGHPYNSENTYKHRNGQGKVYTRKCKTCVSIRMKDYYQRVKLKEANYARMEA